MAKTNREKGQPRPKFFTENNITAYRYPADLVSSIFPLQANKYNDDKVRPLISFSQISTWYNVKYIMSNALKDNMYPTWAPFSPSGIQNHCGIYILNCIN